MRSLAADKMLRMFSGVRTWNPSFWRLQAGAWTLTYVLLLLAALPHLTERDIFRYNTVACAVHHDAWREQALSLVCAFHSPFTVSMSDMETYRQIALIRYHWLGRCCTRITHFLLLRREWPWR